MTLLDSINARAKRREGATAGPYLFDAPQLVYTLKQSGWYKGRPQMVNAMTASVQGDNRTADARHIADNDPATVAALEAVVRADSVLCDAADTVMQMLDGYGMDIVPYLMDTDDNPGQALREAIIASRAALDNLTAILEGTP